MQWYKITDIGYIALQILPKCQCLHACVQSVHVLHKKLAYYAAWHYAGLMLLTFIMLVDVSSHEHIIILMYVYESEG